jgi:hypothetical protein
MDLILQNKEFEWVLKVLESCVSESQIRTTENLYDNFIKKWKHDFSYEKIITFEHTYKNKKTKKIRRLLIDPR